MSWEAAMKTARQHAGVDDEPQENGGSTPKKKSVATVIVEAAAELFAFAVATSGETYGVPRSGPRVMRMVRGGKTSLRAVLARDHFERTGRAAPQQALADALMVIEGLAQTAEQTDLHLRVAQQDGATWLDLGDETGRAVRITANGWAVEDQAPVLFKRTALTAALPEPQRDSKLDELWRWLNVAQPDRPLVAAWLVAALYPEIPHPILSIGGEQGSGKSTAERVLVSIVDPSPVPLRKPPRDVESWVTAAAGSWVVGIDNLSVVPDWLSDAFCRAVSGDGDVRRKLYTDGDVHIFAFKRCLILNGIDIGAVRGDLADRLLTLDFKIIGDTDRLMESEFWPRWADAHPRILGALLDLAAGIAGILPSVHLERRPRMADFAAILAAVDEVTGTSGLNRYLDKQNEVATDALTADHFIGAIEAIGPFTGTSAELLDRVMKPEKLPRGWPADPRAATAHLRRQAPVMRKAGWRIDSNDRANHEKVVVWTIAPPPRDGGNGCPQRPRCPQGMEDSAGIAGIAGIKNGPSQDITSCAHCGQPGADADATDGGARLARVHRACFDAWFEATAS